jgi:DNA-binding NarL/FixJ family response regulator
MSAPLHSESASVPALRVVLVEDSAMLRGMLCEMLAELDGVGVVAEAEDEQGALAALEAQRPDLAIIDLELRMGSGLGVLRQLQAEPERFGRPRAGGVLQLRPRAGARALRAARRRALLRQILPARRADRLRPGGHSRHSRHSGLSRFSACVRTARVR